MDIRKERKINQIIGELDPEKGQCVKCNEWMDDKLLNKNVYIITDDDGLHLFTKLCKSCHRWISTGVTSEGRERCVRKCSNST